MVLVASGDVALNTILGHGLAGLDLLFVESGGTASHLVEVVVGLEFSNQVCRAICALSLYR